MSGAWNPKFWTLGSDEFSMSSTMVPQILVNLVDINKDSSTKKRDESIMKKLTSSMQNMEDSSLYKGENEAFFITKESRNRKAQIDVLQMNVDIWET